MTSKNKYVVLEWLIKILGYAISIDNGINHF